LEVLEGRLAPATLTVNSAADNTSDTSVLTLRDAITLVNSGGNPASLGQTSMPAGWQSQISGGFVNAVGGTSQDTIQFAQALDGQTITLSAGSARAPGWLEIGKNVSIIGPGAGQLTVSGNHVTTIFLMAYDPSGVPTAVSLSGLTIANAQSLTGEGGAIENNGATLTVSSCTFTGNSAPGGEGGAIVNGATLTLTNSILYGNSAGSGGGIANGGTATVINSTLANNSAGSGGGIQNSGILTLTNSTLYNNQATNGNGGGIANFGFNNFPGTLTLTNSTLSSNSANNGSGGGIYQPVGGGSPNPSIANSIIAGNAAMSGPDVYGAVTSQGYNLIGNTNGGSGFAGTDLVNVNPLLGPLQDNGGPTPTMAELPGSPAIGNGSLALAVDPSTAPPTPLLLDQRGFARTTNGQVDIGAFEVQVFAVNNTADNISSGSLRWALTHADQAGGSVINITATGTINLLSALPHISRSVQIFGPGANNLTVQRSMAPGTPGFGIFTVDAPTGGITDVTVALSGLTIANGNASSIASSLIGGGISNAATLLVSNCALTGNSAFSEGGGIVNSGTLTLTNSTLAGNFTSPGGSLTGGGIWNIGTLSVTNSTLASNSAASGGGIANFGTLTLTNSTLYHNQAIYDGGGITSESLVGYPNAVVTITNSTLSGNSAAFGGGINNFGPARLIVANTIVAGNTAPTGPDAYGPVTSRGSNLIGDADGSSGLLVNGVAVNGDLVGTGTNPLNALLAPLGNYGGPTQTMALLPGSLALGSGNISLAVDPSSGQPLTTDQRGFARTRNGTVDIGALESRGFTIAVLSGDNQQLLIGGVSSMPLTVHVIANAQGEPVTGGLVYFAAPPTGASATLNGSPATIDANGNASVTAAPNNTLGSYTVSASYTRTPGATNIPAVFHLTNTITTASLQQALGSTPGNSVTVNASTTADANTVLSAVSTLRSTTSGTLSLNLVGTAKYGSMAVSAPPNLRVSINGQRVSQLPTRVDPDVPALIVTSGQVVVSYVTFSEFGDAPTILVTGGSLTLRNDVVQESTGFTDAAIELTGGTLDLGTAADPGGNTFNVNGTGEFVHNTTGNSVPAVGDIFEVNGTPLAAPSLSFTTLTSSASITVLGQSVTFTASIRPNGSGTPSGSVDFFDATTNTDLGSVPLSGGQATQTTTALDVGTHTIQAFYSGDSTFLPSLDAVPATVENSTLNGIGPGDVFVIDTTGVTLNGIPVITVPWTNVTLTVNGMGGNDTFVVLGTNPGSTTILNAVGSGNTFKFGSATATLDPVQGAVTVNGGGSDTMSVYDQGTTVSQDYGVYATSIHRSNVTSPYADNIAPIDYQQVANLNLYLGQAQSGINADVIRNIADVFSTAPGTTTTIYGGSGRNSYTVAPFDAQPGLPLDNTGIQGAVSVHGGGNTYDTLTYYDFLDPQPQQTYAMTATQISDVTAVGFAPVTFDAKVHYVGLFTSLQGSNTVNLLSTAATTYATGIDAEANDTVRVGTPTSQGGTLANLLGSVVTIGTNTPSQSATVTLDDSGDSQTGKQVTFGNQGAYGWGVSGLSAALIALNPGTGSSVNLLGSSPAAGLAGSNVYAIQSVPAGISLGVKAGTGGDVFLVGSTANTLDPIQGPLTVVGQGTNTTLNINDQANSGSQRYEYDVYADHVVRIPQPQGSPTQTIGYSGIANLTLHGSNTTSENLFGVIATPLGTAVALYAGSASNEFFVGSSSAGEGLNNIQGPLALYGTNTEAIAFDYPSASGHNYTFSSPSSATTLLQRDSMAPITYHDPGTAAGLIFYAPLVGGNHINVQSEPANLLMSIGVYGPGDTVTAGSLAPTLGGTLAGILGDLVIGSSTHQSPAVILDDSNDSNPHTIGLGSDPFFGYEVSGLLPPSSVGRGRIGLHFDPTTPVSILGGPADDVFRIQDFTGAPALSLVAEPATSTRTNRHNNLDYSAYTGTVEVVLPLGYATGFAGISGIQDVTGGMGNSMLVGDANPNILVGGTGRNVIIGGAGADTLDASRASGDNILIGGTTDFDSNLAALKAIFAEWTRTDLSYKDRFSDLTTGTNGQNATPLNRVNGQLILLTPTTIHADSSPDQLIGSNLIDPATGKRVHNWFFVDADDTVVNFLNSSDHETKVK
jgi:hypothetical protein